MAAGRSPPGVTIGIVSGFGGVEVEAVEPSGWRADAEGALPDAAGLTEVAYADHDHVLRVPLQDFGGQWIDSRG